jgi:preprotein translocase subunit YajC
MKILLIVSIVVFVVLKIFKVVEMRARAKHHKELLDWIDKGM